MMFLSDELLTSSMNISMQPTGPLDGCPPTLRVSFVSIGQSSRDVDAFVQESLAHHVSLCQSGDCFLGEPGLVAFIGDGVCVRVLALSTSVSRHNNHNRSIRVVERGLRTLGCISANPLEAGKMRGIPRSRCIHLDVEKRIEIALEFALADLAVRHFCGFVVYKAEVLSGIRCGN